MSDMEKSTFPLCKDCIYESCEMHTSNKNYKLKVYGK